MHKEVSKALDFQEIYYEKEFRNNPIVENVRSSCAGASFFEVDDIRNIINQYRARAYPAEKDVLQKLLMGRQRGPFLKSCPCSCESVSCGYYYLNVGIGCPLECSYCYLQDFLTSSFPVVYINTDDLFTELSSIAKKGYARIGTGELTDSLVFEPVTQYSKLLVSHFNKLQNMVLELKTKSNFISSLLEIPAGNTLVSWSLNPPNISKIEEPFSPSPKERLLAAKKVQEAGYKVAFHLDPLILTENWEEEYRALVEEIFATVDKKKLSWISLGTLRIFPSLRDTIRARHPESRTLFAELIPSYDGKLRYFKAQRVEMYKKVYQWIREFSDGQTLTYLCMESRDVWDKVFSQKSNCRQKLVSNLNEVCDTNWSSPQQLQLQRS